jgi:iron complex outermembrane receptor protein
MRQSKFISATNKKQMSANQGCGKRAVAFRRTILSSCVAAAVAGVVMPAQAQVEDRVLEEVIVTATGYRKSIINAIDEKRFSSSVVESISAEDIGKLPDSSIAESIARLPGLAAQRLDGRASSISVRGFNEDFSTTTFNGREQVSIDDNRGVQFDVYPSEIISGVTVYKTPTASIVNQGIAGTIDLRTVRPLEVEEGVMQLNVSVEQNSLNKLNADGEDTGYRGTFSFVDKFANDTVGVALAIATLESPNQEERWNAWGYAQDADGNAILGGAKPFVRSSNLQRDTVMAVVEFAPNDRLNITADALFIDFLDEKILRGIEVPGAFGGGFGVSSDTSTVSDGFVTSGTFNNVQGVIRNDFEERDATLKNFGLNVKYALTDSVDIEFDASTSQAERLVNSLETYSGTGRGTGVGASDDIGFSQNGDQFGVNFTSNLDYSDPNLVQLGGPLSWGNGNTVPSDGQDGFINSPEIDDELNAFKVMVNKSFNEGLVTRLSAGVNYSERTKSKLDTGSFLTLNGYPERIGVPEGFRVADTSLDFLGLGSIQSYDSKGLLDAGFYTLTSEDNTSGNRARNTWSVTEEITTAFVKADFETELAGKTIMGNIGVQYVDSDQSSIGNAVGNVNGFVTAQRVTGGVSFSDVLPSLNMTMQLTENQQVRLGLARTLSRSRMDRINASFGLSFDTLANSVGAPAFNASGGNPELRPNEADQIDLSYEYYFSDDGYVSVAYFYKDLRTWQEQVVTPRDFTGVEAPGFTGVVNTTAGFLTAWTDTTTGSIDGYEVTAVLPGRIIAPALDGFGLSVSGSFLDSSLDSASDSSPIVVPGLSEEIVNATVFYEKSGFGARVSVRNREDFLGERFGNSFSREFTTVKGATIWDAQISYDFGDAGFESLDGLAISFQGQNLSDEPYVTVDGNDNVRDFQRYGRTYLINARYKF